MIILNREREGEREREKEIERERKHWVCILSLVIFHSCLSLLTALHVWWQLADSVADNEDVGRQMANLRRKLQRGNQDMADLRLHLEEQVGRNAELEKKQRK